MKWQHYIGYAVCIVLGLMLFRQCEKAKDAENRSIELADWLNDISLKLNVQEAQNIYLSELTREQLLAIKGLTGDKKKLQELVEYNKKAHSAIVASLKAQISNQTPTTIIRVDTVGQDIFPVYFSKFSDRFLDYEITASKDSILVNLETIVNLEFLTEKTKEGHLVKAKTDNPYITFQGIQGIELKTDAKKWGFCIAAGPGLFYSDRVYLGGGVIVGIGRNIR